MDFHFSDNDIGDWFTEYGIEENDWFYLDFEKGEYYMYSLIKLFYGVHTIKPQLRPWLNKAVLWRAHY